MPGSAAASFNWRRPSGIRDSRPTEAVKGVLDAKTFDAIETDQLFDSLNHAVTHAGQSVLYRSLARPGIDAEVTRKNRGIARAGIDPACAKPTDISWKRWRAGEQSLYQLLYGTFTGGLAIDNSRAGKDEMEFSGYGYHQFVDGTGFCR